MAKISIVLVLFFSCATSFSNPNKFGCSDDDCLQMQRLGESYLNGGKEKEALPLLKKAFEKGSFWAATDLGTMYENGLGVEKDLEKAKYYYEFGASHGDEVALYNIGEAYFLGNLSPQDFSKAKTYFERINQDGQAIACASHLLGVIYIQGLASSVDENKAKAYFTKAVSFGVVNFMEENSLWYGLDLLFTNYAEIYTAEMLKKYSPATKNAVFLSKFTEDFDHHLIKKCLDRQRFIFIEKFIPNKIMD